MQGTMNRSGFTLIESIMTLVVLSIAAIGVLTVFAVGMKGSADPLIMTQAIQLAQGEMDQVLGERASAGFASIATGSCRSTMLAGFTCSRTVSYVNTADLNAAVGGPTNYKHVTVTVARASFAGINLDTVLANY
jgi:prepilin-type N-terminal cleavage/methylation domain-containing protein